MIDRENDGRFIDIIPDLACDSAITRCVRRSALTFGGSPSAVRAAASR
jgi:hypothetical protein